MHPAPAISRSPFGRTLRIAGWILAAAAVAEIGAAGYALIDRARHVPPLSISVAQLSATADNSSSALPAHPAAPAFNDPFASIASASPAANAPSAFTAANPPAKSGATPPMANPVPVVPAPAPSVAPALSGLPKPTPVDEGAIIAPQSRVDALVAQATALSQRGDTSTAVTRLREALAMAPKSPQVIAQLAMTYEKMDLEDRALEEWRIIFDMGESAGIYYQLADAKLKASTVSDGANASPTPDTSGDAGFQQGSVLALTSLSTVEKPDTAEGYKRFTLKIPVKRKPDVKVDVTSVVIQVFFYDQLGDDTVVRTNALVSDHWNALPADWVQDDTEILDVDYTQAPPEPGKIEAGRHYYGYVVCIYYNKQLQDQASDPVELIKSNPPPLTLPESK